MSKDGLNVLKNLQPYTPKIKEIDELLNELICYERPVEKVYYFYSAEGVCESKLKSVVKKRSGTCSFSSGIDINEVYDYTVENLETIEPKYKWVILSLNKL